MNCDNIYINLTRQWNGTKKNKKETNNNNFIIIQSEKDSEWSSSATPFVALICWWCASCSCDLSSNWRQVTSLICWDSRCCLRHLMRRFWNQTFTCDSDRRRLAANTNLSGPTMYCCRANSASNRSNCSALKMVRTLFALGEDDGAESDDAHGSNNEGGDNSGESDKCCCWQPGDSLLPCSVIDNIYI